MLPADSLTEIITNLAGLRLEPQTTMAVLGAVLAPLLRSADPDPPALPRPRAGRPPRSKPQRATRRRRKKSRPRVATVRSLTVEKRRAKSDTVTDLPTAGRATQHQRALAALKANRGVSLTRVAAIAKCSRSTVSNAARELGAEACKQQASRKALKPETVERRERAQRFLREQLGGGPKAVTDVEAAASKAHVDTTALEQARADLHVVTSRGNAGGVMAVQWSLPD